MLPRVVLITRPTELDGLLARHGTLGQAEFFLKQRGREVAPLLEARKLQEQAVQTVLAAVPARWRRSQVSRAELDRFLFEPEDLVVAVGQDGLVANVARFLDGQPVLGVNPDRRRYDGVLVPLTPQHAAKLLEPAAAGQGKVQPRALVEATLRDGQKIRAVNEIFLGHRSHQSARYTLSVGGKEERQSSSGVLVVTGTGATGWARSIKGQRAKTPPLPGATEAALVFLVREPFPSKWTGTSLDAGRLEPGETLRVTSDMDEGGVLFGDGMEADHLAFPWGEVAEVGLASQRLNLVRA